MFTLRLLGGLTLEGPSGPVSGRVAQRRRLGLLALLGVAGEKGLSRDKLAGYLWPESDEASARHMLSDTLYVLRKALGEEALLASGDFLRLNPAVVECDLRAFEAALDEKRFEAALSVYAGPFLDGFYLGGEGEFDAWVEGERQRLAELYAKALKCAAEEAHADGDEQQAVEWWKKLAAYDPFNSRVIVRLMEGLAAAGDPANALEILRVHELRLRDELGLELPEELRAFGERLRAEPVAGQATAAEAPQTVSPAAAVGTAPAGEVPRRSEAPRGWRGWVHEIHRRSLWQVLLIYVGGALVAYEAVQALTEGLGLPSWFPGFAVVLFIILLPVVMATAMVQEGGPLAARDRATPVPIQGSVVSGMEAAAARREVRGLRRVLTWRRAILGGVGAFALLGVGTTGYMGMRVLGIGPPGTLIAKGVLEERDLIVLADFEDNTGDSVLALTVTEAMRVRLEQSPVVRSADDDYVGRVLKRMEREPDAPLTYDLAREVAIREGLKAVVTGQVNPAGSGYVLSARLVAAETGETLDSFLETAADPEAIIPAIDRLSAGMRERIGESLGTVRASPPLAQVQTASLEALRLLTQARELRRRGEFRRAAELASHAIEIDSACAGAYVERFIAFQNLEQEGEQQRADITRAYELRHRLPLAGRYVTEGLYHFRVTRDYERMVEAYRMVMELRPENPPLGELGFAYDLLGDKERSAEMYRRAMERSDSLSGVLWWNWARALWKVGKYDEAWEAIREWEAKMPEHWDIPNLQALFASAQGDYDAAEIYLARWRDLRREDLIVRALINQYMVRLAQVQGKLVEAEKYNREVMRLREELGHYDAYVRAAIRNASLWVWFRGDTARALETLATAIERHPLDSIEPRSRPYRSLAKFYAFAGALERARELLVEWETLVPPQLRRGAGEVDRHRAWGAIALAEGRADEALEEFRLAREVIDDHLNPLRGLALLARAYELAGQPDSAVAMYEEYLTTPDFGRVLWGRSPADERDPEWLPVVYERLGDLYEQRGDTAKAIYYYGKLVDLWKDADPELQPRVEAARRAIEALSPDR